MISFVVYLITGYIPYKRKEKSVNLNIYKVLVKTATMIKIIIELINQVGEKGFDNKMNQDDIMIKQFLDKNNYFGDINSNIILNFRNNNVEHIIEEVISVDQTIYYLCNRVLHNIKSIEHGPYNEFINSKNIKFLTEIYSNVFINTFKKKNNIGKLRCNKEIFKNFKNNNIINMFLNRFNVYQIKIDIKYKDRKSFPLTTQYNFDNIAIEFNKLFDTTNNKY